MSNEELIRLRKSKANATRIVGAVFALFSVLFLIIGIIVFCSVSKTEREGTEVVATVTSVESYRDNDGDISYRVFVTFTYEGNEYKDVKLGYYDSTTYEGNTVKVIVDPEHPRNIVKRGEGIFFILIFGFFALIFGIIGFTILGIEVAGNRKKKYLMENGRLIHAVIEGIELNTFITVNDMHPYNVFCGYVDPTTGEKIDFKSNNLFFNPNEFYEIGSYIDVYVDQNSYKKYYVDVRNKALEGNYDM